ncbi:MAG: hypothetical protein RLZZ53_628 [Acidobacteriota bacterium]|jgi:hypothetical protein
MTKLVAQTFKAPGQWQGPPPGLGDFIRGACHLFEHLEGTGVEFRLDVSQSGFAGLIKQDPAVFHAGAPDAIASAGEHFEDDAVLLRELDALARAGEGVLHVCSNMGAWHRRQLPEHTRNFVSRFYAFVPEIEDAVTQATGGRDYRVLSVRCGDRFFDEPSARVDAATESTVCRIIERHVLPGNHAPVVVISDCDTLRESLRARYGFTAMPYRSRHGANGGADAVAHDLCLLKRSSANVHINAWSDWWSGFSHYTSMLFSVPSVNFRAPRFEREEVTGAEPRPAWRWRPGG